MFKINDVVSYQKVGLCTIKEEQFMYGRDYFILYSLTDDLKIMCPKEQAQKMMRPTISKKELKAIIEKVKSHEVTETELKKDLKERKNLCAELLSTGEVEHWLIILNILKDQKDKAGRLATTEETILETTQKLLFEEVKYVMGDKKSLEEILGLNDEDIL